MCGHVHACQSRQDCTCPSVGTRSGSIRRQRSRVLTLKLWPFVFWHKGVTVIVMPEEELTLSLSARCGQKKNSAERKHLQQSVVNPWRFKFVTFYRVITANTLIISSYYDAYLLMLVPWSNTGVTHNNFPNPLLPRKLLLSCTVPEVFFHILFHHCYPWATVAMERKTVRRFKFRVLHSDEFQKFCNQFPCNVSL